MMLRVPVSGVAHGVGGSKGAGSGRLWAYRTRSVRAAFPCEAWEREQTTSNFFWRITGWCCHIARATSATASASLTWFRRFERLPGSPHKMQHGCRNNQEND